MGKSKDDYYAGIALAVSERSTCKRRKFGAVIVNNDQLISTGYSGSPRGTANCVDIDLCRRDDLNIPKGENYELCRSVHAEQNATIHSSRLDMEGGVLYLAGKEVSDGSLIEDAEPCQMCKRFIVNAGILSVIVLQPGNKLRRLEVEEWIATQMNEIVKKGDR